LHQGGERSPVRVNDHPLYRLEHRFPGDGASRHERVDTAGAQHRQQGIHQYLHIRMLPEALGVEQGFLQQWLEQFRLDYRFCVAYRFNIRIGRWLVGDTRSQTVTCFKARAILDDHEGSSQHYHFDNRRAR